MAEAFLNLMAGDRFEAESAGLEPGILNPLAVEVMKEIGIDISGYRTKKVFLNSLRRGSYSIMLLLSVMRPAEIDVRSFPAIQKGFTGIFLTLQHWKETMRKN